MKKILGLLFVICAVTGCEENVTPPRSEVAGLTAAIERGKGEYVLDSGSKVSGAALRMLYDRGALRPRHNDVPQLLVSEAATADGFDLEIKDRWQRILFQETIKRDDPEVMEATVFDAIGGFCQTFHRPPDVGKEK